MLIAQLLLDALSRAGVYFLVSLCLALPLHSAGVFHIAAGGILVVAGYVVVSGTVMLGLPLWFSALLGALLSVATGLGIERFVYRPLALRRASGFVVAVASLGLYLALVNGVAALYGNRPLVLIQSWSSLRLGGLVCSPAQASAAVAATVVALTLAGVLHTRVGHALRASGDSPELLRACGYDLRRVRLVVAAGSSLLAALAGMLSGIDRGVEPEAGMTLVLSGLAVVVITGPSVSNGMLTAAVLVSVSQALAGYFAGPRWEETVTLGVLVLALALRPSGFFANHLRADEAR